MGSDAFQSIKGRMHGLRNVRDLNVYDTVNVATKITVIANINHIQKIALAKNTEMTRTLGRIGTTSGAYLQEVVLILSKELGIDYYQVVEILICEILRREESGGTDRFTGVDTIMVDQPLYQIDEYGVLWMTEFNIYILGLSYH